VDGRDFADIEAYGVRSSIGPPHILIAVSSPMADRKSPIDAWGISGVDMLTEVDDVGSGVRGGICRQVSTPPLSRLMSLTLDRQVCKGRS
jgi:hypothetical protein